MNDGGPAFPTTEYYNEKPVCDHGGMSLRDWFAGQAMMGLFVQQGILEKPYKDSAEKTAAFARVAYQIADAMIAKREADRR